MKTPHYLRFVQALVLAAAVPACSSGDDPAPPAKSDPPASSTTKAVGAPAATEAPPAPASPAPHAAPVVEPQPAAQGAEHADSSPDSGLPFSSGPIVPPELPASFA